MNVFLFHISKKKIHVVIDVFFFTLRNYTTEALPSGVPPTTLAMCLRAKSMTDLANMPGKICPSELIHFHNFHCQ